MTHDPTEVFATNRLTVPAIRPQTGPDLKFSAVDPVNLLNGALKGINVILVIWFIAFLASLR